MGVLLAVSLAAWTAACIGSLWIAARTGETRVGILSALFALLATQQGIAAWSAWGEPLGFDLTTAGAASGVAAAAAGLLALWAVTRTLRELDRAETLHWESMETVRELTDLAGRPELELEERMRLLLEMGCARLGLELGWISHVKGDRYELLAVRAPEDFPSGAGSVLSRAETRCRVTLESERPVAATSALEAPSAEASIAGPLPCEAYLGARIRVGDEPFGTLVFASRSVASERFQATQKDLVALMAQWIGMEIERRDSRLRPEAGGGSPEPRPGRAAPPRRAVPTPTAPLDLAASLDQLRRRIERAAGAGVEVHIETAPDLARVEATKLPLDAIVLSLVGTAADALSEGEGGRLTISAENVAAPGPGDATGTGIDDGFVTLSVRDDAGRWSGADLEQAFDPEAGPGPAAGGRLPLAAVRRLVGRAGGDLSVDVEPGRGTTFTLFLPRHRETVPRSSAPAAGAPAPAGH